MLTYTDAMAVSVNVTILLEGENYSIVEIPPHSSAIVRKQKEGLLQQVDLKAFVEDLGRVGGFVRVAYNAATAAGPEFADLQVEIQKIGFEVADLCDASAITVAKFQDASGSILDDLQATYEYLMEGETEMALEIYKGIAKVAGEMFKAAETLQQKFDEEKKKVEGTVAKTIEKRGAKALEVQKIIEDREKAEKEKIQQEEQLKKVVKDEDDAMEMYKHARDKQDEALDDATKVGFWGAMIGRRRAHDKKADEWKEQRKETLKMLDNQRNSRMKALDEIGKAAKTLIECSQEKQNVSEAAVSALHQAEAGLRSLSIVMRQAAQFWKHMEEHCKELANPRVAREFKMLEKKETPEERIKIFTSRPFKRGAIDFYARWVALNAVSSEYMEHIKRTQKELYSHIRECPTYEQARSDIGKLAQKFLADVETAQEDLRKKHAESDDEKKALEAPPSGTQES